MDEINNETPVIFFGGEPQGARQKLGVVVGGSLSEGVLVKLDRDTLIEGLSVGSYVTIDGQTNRKFFGLITDIALDATDQKIQKTPPTDEFIAQVYRGTAVYGTLAVKPMLVMEAGAERKPIKTVPAHFTQAYRSTPEEVQAIFAEPDSKTYEIGSALDNDKLNIRLNLERFVERSSAVFGRSGTGKTFLTLPLLASVIHQQLASVLIFDMHNDYGYTLKGDKNRKLKGLKQLNAIASRITIVTLDEASSRLRNSRPEFALKIGYDQIEVEDIEMLRDVLSLSDVQVNALFLLKRKFPKDWIRQLLNDEVDPGVQELFDSGKIVEGTYGAMQRKLTRLLKFDFLQDRVADDFVTRIIGHLERGESVVVEFGRYGSDLPAYVFVANFLTRRIHRRYVEMKETAEGSGGAEPQKLVIAIEEAHKFLEPGIAELTIFGTIARELRKYNVTLLIVDQRPSQIDAEVMSQIGTRITCALSDEKDISAVFTGVSGAQELRSVLAALDSKQQALIMGHAVPMPVVVKTAEYGEAMYKRYAIGDDAEKRQNLLHGKKSAPDDLI
ncbi:MAG TPA: ATP-binding protein [Thermoflexales bacterium]|nr:ATP-binding protein [Thermoflexales bacterium]